MRLLLTALALTVVVAACGSEISRGDPTAPPPLPIPANLSGIPGATDVTALVEPHSPAGELREGDTRATFQLGHCGLSSPIDIDGSLWDPISSYGLLTGEHKGELINSTPTSVFLDDPDTLVMRTPAGALIVLQRHHGPRRYFLCD